MGRNGAGKSTLLRMLAGLIEPTRGKVMRAGRVALLLQNPGDYFLHDRIGDDVPNAGALADRHPRDVSGGERQRLALEIVLTSGTPPVAVCLDEPTRGMDRGHGARLAARLRELAADGTAVLVATHDAEFAAAWADRTILLGDGRPVADAPTAEVLGGGWYFATQTARVLGGGALLPEDGAALLRAPERWWRGELGRRLDADPRRRAGRRLRLVRAHAPDHARDRAGGDAGGAGGARPDRVRARSRTSSRPPTSCSSRGFVLGGAPGFAVGSVAALASNLFFGQGPWTPWQMVGWGGVGVVGALLGARHRPRARPRVPLALACGGRRGRVRRVDEHPPVGHLLGRPHARRARRRTSRRRCGSTSRTWSAASSSASPSGPRWCARWRATARASTCAGSPRPAAATALIAVVLRAAPPPRAGVRRRGRRRGGQRLGAAT